jgi:hypothetical protein
MCAIQYTNAPLRQSVVLHQQRQRRPPISHNTDRLSPTASKLALHDPYQVFDTNEYHTQAASASSIAARIHNETNAFASRTTTSTSSNTTTTNTAPPTSLARSPSSLCDTSNVRQGIPALSELCAYAIQAAGITATTSMQYLPADLIHYVQSLPRPWYTVSIDRSHCRNGSLRQQQREPTKMLLSSATLIVVPSQLIQQWESEFLKVCTQCSAVQCIIQLRDSCTTQPD